MDTVGCRTIIIYTSLVKLPLPVISVEAALAQIYQYVEKPPALDNVKSEIHLIDEYIGFIII